MLHYLCVGVHMTITQPHTQALQQTQMYNCVEGKKLLSYRRQSDYNNCAHKDQCTCADKILMNLFGEVQICREKLKI